MSNDSRRDRLDQLSKDIGAKEELRREICSRDSKELGELKWQGLGRDVHDFLTARQHGWDRASGGGFGSGDRMP